MNRFTDSMQTGTAHTANGAVTNESTLNECLDLFFLAGASRNISEKEITSLFIKAYNENKNNALKILFWARDVRGGAGERRIFRILIKYVAHNYTELFNQLMEYIPHYGRWDDLFFDEDILRYTIDFIKGQVFERKKEAGELGLLFKWLPREKSAKGNIAKLLMKKFEMNPMAYRKLLAQCSETVEDKMCAKEWDSIKYNTIPSRAFAIYSQAYMRHDETRFSKFIEKVEEGEETINASAIFPSDLFKKWRGGETSWYCRTVQPDKEITKAVNAQWSQLPDYLNDEDILPVCDTSGSMYGEPICVAVSLGVYLSERSKGKFKDYMMTFEGRPKLHHLTGTPCERFSQIMKLDSDCSTNLYGVFQLILSVAIRDQLTEKDMPSKLLIISDMEFNCANYNQNTNFQEIDSMYKRAGLKRPALIFWNVNGRPGNNPAQEQDRNVGLVSGYSPAIMKSVLGGEDFTPLGVMLKTLESYSFIDKLC